MEIKEVVRIFKLVFPMNVSSGYHVDYRFGTRYPAVWSDFHVPYWARNRPKVKLRIMVHAREPEGYASEHWPVKIGKISSYWCNRERSRTDVGGLIYSEERGTWVSDPQSLECRLYRIKKQLQRGEICP